jgi:two-component system chemotaxis sensor kinase CheA
VEISGEEVELDRAVLDSLDDPLLHLVRNAIDHGIESPAERERMGKPERGTIRLSATQAGSRVRVRVEDDGVGIDVEGVRRNAVAQGLLVEAVAEDLPPERVLELVFEPGLTTRSEVTAVSGRGVGLDAVKRVVDGLGGAIRVESRPGGGTAFELDLPSVVALQRVVVLEVAKERVALPAACVLSVLSVSEGKVETAGGDAFFHWGEEPLPLADLGTCLGVSGKPDHDRGLIAVVETQRLRLGLRADRLGGHLEVFIREVPPALRPIEMLGGVSILPDGAPIFLLDLGQVVEALA